MLESARKVHEYIHGISFEEFWESSTVRDAVALRLAMIGEAARRVDVKTQKALPAIPFAQIGGLRNHIVHDYGAINFRIVWKIAREDILPLVGVLKKYLAE
jgi:uncharacterized protein with HEPN domain